MVIGLTLVAAGTVEFTVTVGCDKSQGNTYLSAPKNIVVLFEQ